MRPLTLSSLGYAAAAGLALWVIHPWPAGIVAAVALSFASAAVAAMADDDDPSNTRKDPS